MSYKLPVTARTIASLSIDDWLDRLTALSSSSISEILELQIILETDSPQSGVDRFTTALP